MTRLVSALKRDHVREMAHTAKMVAGAISMGFTAVAMAAIAVGSIHVLIRIW